MDARALPSGPSQREGISIIAINELRQALPFSSYLRVKKFADRRPGLTTISGFLPVQPQFCVSPRHLKQLLAASDHRRASGWCAAWQAIRQMF